MRSLVDIGDLSVAELDELLRVGSDIAEHPETYADACRRKKLATLFFEPSTRTRLSFEAAMLELGGSVIGFEGASSSSSAKGESVADTARVISAYADIVAMRHPREGAALVAAENATVPVINAGDGGHAHPTQTLTDLMTIRRRHGRLSGLTVGFCGDLKNGRTVHSLIAALSRYSGNSFVLISPKELRLPSEVREACERLSIPLTETEGLEAAIPGLDVLYMTRIQRERFLDSEEYERLKDSYVLTPEKLTEGKEELSILHPLPRVNEISIRVDSDPRAAYFEQVENGKWMRMALILMLLAEAGIDRTPRQRQGTALPHRVCQNPACITQIEQELAPRFLDGRCVFCEK